MRCRTGTNATRGPCPRAVVAVASLCLVLLLAGCQGQAKPSPATKAAALESGSLAPIPTATGSGATAVVPGSAAGNTVLPATPVIPATQLQVTAEPPTATKTATATTTASPPPTTTPSPKVRQLTTGGCCWDPFFLDGRVTFIDRPAQDAQSGFYAVPLAGGQERLIEPRMGFFLAGGAYFSYEEGASTVIERRSDGQRWKLNTAGQPVTLSPDGSEAAWSVRDWEGAFDRRVSRLWRAPVEGGKAVQVMSLYGGGLVAWLPGDRWLISGRRALGELDRALFVYDLKTGESRDLMRAQGFRSIAVAPDGQSAVVIVALDPAHDRNGTWLVPLGEGAPRKLAWFGAFDWRDPGHIYYMPYEEEAASDEVWLYEVATGSSRRVTDPAVTPFKIAQGDWVMSPDGKSLVFVSASDLNLWVLELNP